MVQTRRGLIVALVTLVLAGCATTAKYEKILDAWVGHSTDELIRSWGPPQNTSALQNGDHVIEYDSHSTFQTGGYTYSVPITTYNSGNVTMYGDKNITNGYYNGKSTTYVQKQMPLQTVDMNCTTLFTINSKDIIEKWSWEGNNCSSQ